MSTAKKALFAAVGAGDLALEQAKSLPKRVTTLPTQLRSSADDLRTLSAKNRKRAQKQFTDLSKRGEKLVKKIQRSAPAKRVRKPAKADATATTEMVEQAG